MPLLTTLFLFFYFALCGRGWLAAFHVNLGHTRSWLLAPSLGVALNAVVILSINQAGLPVACFARPLAASLLLLSLSVIVWRRSWRLRGMTPFVALALAVLVVGAWPMLRYGYNWISYGNDDMTNYCLAAQRVLHYGFYRVPLLSELAGGDYSQFYWFMYVAHLTRAGSEFLLAGAAGALDRPPIEIFMPMIFSLALTQLWALGALIYSCPRKKSQALLACAFLAVSPLWIYGTLLQLIAQVGGIALLLSSLTLTARCRFASSWAGRIRQAAVIGLATAGIAVIYPEVIPFFVLSLGLYTTVLCLRTLCLIPGQLSVALLSLTTMCLMIRHNILSTFTMLVGQTAGGLRPEDITQTIFPYFLMPKGSSFLVGLDAIIATWPEPLGSICIGTSLGILAMAVYCSFKGILYRQPASYMMLIMVVVGAKLFLGNNGFGLFKLAMFIIPFLLAEIAKGLCYMDRWFVIGVSVVLAIMWLSVGQQYVRCSTPFRNNIYTEIKDGPTGHGQMPSGPESFLSDITSSPVAKLTATEPDGAPVVFLSQQFFKRLAGKPLYSPPAWFWKLMPVADIPNSMNRLNEELSTKVFSSQKAFGTNFWSGYITDFSAIKTMLTSQAELKSFNKLSHLETRQVDLYVQIPIDTLKNHLVFIHSEAGQHYYLGEPGFVGAYKPQPDVYAPERDFFAIGKKLVFQVLNPSPLVRLRLSVTDSILGSGRTRLPEKAAAFGTQSAATVFGLVGAGSANVYSAPIEPLYIEHRSYVALDLARLPAHFSPGEKQGLNRLYNNNVQLDPRLINGYCRDISLISEEDYQKMPRPSTLLHFPHDLVEQDNLEYSGLYEDGWMSRQAFVILGAAQAGQKILVKGMVPQLPDDSLPNNTVEVRINGTMSATTHLSPGNFEIVCPVNYAARSVRIDFHFSREGHLPSNDQRPVAALLTSIAIQTEN